MALPKFNLDQVNQPQVQVDTFKHPDLGYLKYEPQTMRILGHTRDKLHAPINLAGVVDKRGNSFADVPQPYVNTCSQPVHGNAGCPKWAACPFKNYPHVGPVELRVRHNDDVSYTTCIHFYEVLDGAGRPITQNHLGMDGWTVDVDDITHPMVSYKPVGRDPITHKVQTKVITWDRLIPNLGPPWWPQIKAKIAELKAKGEPVPKELELPRSAQLYPELVGEDECLEESGSAPSPPSVSRSGRRKRTGSTSRRGRRETDSTNADSGAAPSA